MIALGHSYTHVNFLITIESDDRAEYVNLSVTDVGNDIVVVALLVLREYTEVRQTGIFHLRTGHVVLADSLEVQHLGVECAVMGIPGRVANGHTCNVG